MDVYGADVNGAEVNHVDVPGGTGPQYDFFGAAPAVRELPPTPIRPTPLFSTQSASTPSASTPSASTQHSPVASEEPSRLPAWVFAVAIGQGSLVAASSFLAYSSLRAVTGDGAATDRYQQNYLDAVTAHLSILVGFVAILSLSIVISALGASRNRVSAEVLGWCQGTLLLLVLVTAFAPPTVPGGLWVTSGLGRPYGFSLTGLIALAGAVVVLASMVRRYLVDAEGG